MKEYGVYTKNGVEFPVIWMDFYITNKATCGLYASCNKVPEVAQMASSGQGFLQFQVNNDIG
jgi:hypothetical protein